MIKIGITGFAGRTEGYFAVYGTSQSFTKQVAFARGVVPPQCPGRVRVNNQEIDFEMIVTSNPQHHGAFAFATKCDGYVLIAQSSDTTAKLDELITNILTFEQKTLQNCPITIVSVDKNSNAEFKKFADSKGISYAHVHIVPTIVMPGQQPPPDRTPAVLAVLSALVGRILPGLGTDRVLTLQLTN